MIMWQCVYFLIHVVPILLDYVVNAILNLWYRSIRFMLIIAYNNNDNITRLFSIQCDMY